MAKRRSAIDDKLRLRVIETWSRDQALSFVEIADIVSTPTQEVTAGQVVDVLYQARLVGSTLSADPRKKLDDAAAIIQAASAGSDPSGVLAASTDATLKAIRLLTSRIGDGMPTREVLQVLEGVGVVHERALEAHLITVMAEAMRDPSQAAINAAARANPAQTKQIAQRAADRYNAANASAFDPGDALETEGEET